MVHLNNINESQRTEQPNKKIKTTEVFKIDTKWKLIVLKEKDLCSGN